MRKTWFLFASTLVMLAALAVCPVIALGQVSEDAADDVKAASAGPLTTTITKVRTTVDRMQAEVREKRLAVLVRLQAGEMDAEEALRELDEIPAPASKYRPADGGDAWLSIAVSEGDGMEFKTTVPMALVRWAVSEGPRLLPAEVREEIEEEMGMEMGGDGLKVIVAGIVPFVDILSSVKTDVPIMSFKDDKTSFSIVVQPKPGGQE